MKLSSGNVYAFCLCFVIFSQIFVVATPPNKKGFLGISYKNNNDRVEVIAVVDNSPASNAGIKVGDVLVSMNGK